MVMNVSEKLRSPISGYTVLIRDNKVSNFNTNIHGNNSELILTHALNDTQI